MPFIAFITITEAQAVRFIFDSVKSGKGYGEIIIELNARGYKTGTGNTFGKNSIHEILRNEKYKGIYIFNRTVSHNYAHKRNNHLAKSTDEQIRIEGGMPRIVDDQTFDKVAAMMKGRCRLAPSGNAKEAYLLTGLIRCGTCGAAYVGNRQYSGRNKNLLVVYRCSCKNNKVRGDCKNKDINRNYLEDFVLNRIADVIFSEERINDLIKEYNTSFASLSNEGKAKLKAMYSEKANIETKLSNIADVIAETATKTLFNKIEALEKELAEIELKITKEESSISEHRLTEEELRKSYFHAQQLFLNKKLPQMKQLVNLYLNRVTVFDEYVEVVINNAPSHMKAVGDAPTAPNSELHILRKARYIKQKSTSRMRWTCEFVSNHSSFDTI